MADVGDEVAGREERVESFIAVTGAERSIAEHFLSSFDWNLDRAINFYLEEGGPRGGGPAASDDDEAAARALAGSMSEEDARIAARLMQEDDDAPVVVGTTAAGPVRVDLTGDDDPGTTSARRGPSETRPQPWPVVQEPVSGSEDGEEDEEATMLRALQRHRQAGLTAAREAQATAVAMMNLTRSAMAGMPAGLPSIFPTVAFGGLGLPRGSLGAGAASVPWPRGEAEGAGAAAMDQEEADAALARSLMQEEEERAMRARSSSAAGPGASVGTVATEGALVANGLAAMDGDADHLEGLDRHELEEARMIEAAMLGIPYQPRLPTRGQGRPSSTPHDPAMAEQRTLRREQDDAYEQSLAADRAKQDAVERAARKVAEAARLAQEAEAAAQHAKDKEQAHLAALLKCKRAALPAEPASGEAGVLTLVVRMPDGGRLSRRFSSAHLLQAVFDFIDLQTQGNPKPGAYRLVNSYPRKVFDNSTAGTLQECGITSDTALFLEATG